MALTEKDLLKKKQELETAKSTVAELTGEKNTLLKRLEKEYGCKDIREARKKIKTMQTGAETLEKEIETKTQEIEDKYFNDED